MFAQRASWDLAPTPLAQALAERRARGGAVLDLTDSNPTRCALPGVRAAARAALARLARDPGAEGYEPDPRGAAEARRAVCAYHRAHGAALEPEHVVLSAGTSEGYAHLFRLLADPGDRVLVPQPSYPLFGFLAELESVVLDPYPLRLREDGWHIDLPALRASVTPRTRAILVVHPNNPTGSFVRRHEAETLATLAAERSLALVSDEVFADYGWEAHDPPFGFLDPSLPECLRFVLSGVSKALGLPQWKVSWIAAAGPAALRGEALERLEVVADTFLSVNGPAQLALPELLTHRSAVQAEIRARVAANRDTLDRALATQPGLARLPSEAGWSAIVGLDQDGSPDDAAIALRLLEREGLLVHPGSLFELPGRHWVLSLLPPPERFRAGLAAFLRGLRSIPLL